MFRNVSAIRTWMVRLQQQLGTLKRAVLHRKNALCYRSLNGAEVGDLFMSLIHTCQLCGANSFDYMIEPQRHARELAARPAEWMPWSYRDTLARIRRGMMKPIWAERILSGEPRELRDIPVKIRDLQ